MPGKDGFPLFSVVNNIHRILTDRDQDQDQDVGTTATLTPIDPCPTPPEKKTKNYKSILKSIAILGAGTLAVAGSTELYQQIFSRYERPDYALKPGIYCYERIEERLPREEVFFYSGDTLLAGYYYPVQQAKGLVVFAHGFHAGADDYLPVYEYLTKNRYAVFSFDSKGTYSSAGDSTVGLPEVLVDLDAALHYVKSTPRFQGYPLFLLGHSCGGYAVTAALNLHSDIRACASIAPMNQAASMIIEKGELYTSMLPTDLLTDLPAAFLIPYQKHLFGFYADLTAVDGINSNHIPVLIAHGNRDMVVDFNQSLSVIGRRWEIRPDNVYYYVGKNEQSGHDSIWHSADAVRYQKQISSDFKEINRGDEMTYSEQVQFYSRVDHDRYSAVNEELFSQIIHMFDSVAY